jgi:hypothetical protein
LLRLDIATSSNEVTLGMIVLGLGLGSGMAIYTTVMQSALPDKKGQVSAANTFFRQIGGSIGLAVMGSVMSAAYLPTFRSSVPSALKEVIPDQVMSVFEDPGNLLGGDALARIQADFNAQGPQGQALFNQLRQAMKLGLTQGLHNVFLLCLGLMLIALVVVCFLREIPLSGRKQEQSAEKESEETGETDPLLA